MTQLARAILFVTPIRYRTPLIQQLNRAGFIPQRARVNYLGFSIQLHPTHDNIQNYIYWNRVYDPAQLNILTHTVREGMTFIDCGAHIGLMSLVASALVGPQGKVIAFEPSHDLYRSLSLNIRLNKVRNAVLENTAISNQSGQITLFQARDTAISSVSNLWAGDEHEAVRVQAVSLDDYTDRQGIVPHFIKIDIEGAEALAFRGMERILSSAMQPTILCAVHPDAIRSVGGSVSSIMDTLQQNHYDLRRVTAEALEPIDVGTHENGKFTLLARPTLKA